MNLKTYDEMDVSHRMAYDMGLEAAVDQAAEPDIEAAAEVLDPYMVHPLEVMEATKAVIAAAFGDNNLIRRNNEPDSS